MSGLIDYIDVEAATRNALKSIAACRQEYASLPTKIADVLDQIRRATYSLEQRPSERKVAKLNTLRERHSVLTECLSDLEEYPPYFAVCWDHLEQWERDSLYCRFISRNLGIKAFMAQYHICRSDAYRKSDAALKRLSKLLYW